MKLAKQRVKDILNISSGNTIAVIGDVMLDRFFWGGVTRISPEAPVPVVDLEKEEYQLGGASNVANNLISLGVNTIMCGVIGDDNTGRLCTDIIESQGIKTDGLYLDKNRPTTIKTRIIGNHQHIVRLDREVREPINEECENFIMKSLANIQDLKGIIFEDYNKGTVTESLIKKVIEFSMKNDIKIYVDPKFDNFFAYQNCFLFKPNRKEAAQAIGKPMKTKEEVLSVAKLIQEKLHCDNILLTLGADGMILLNKSGSIDSFPTLVRQVADVSGAGDTVIAAFAAACAGGASVQEASIVSNYAAGVVCEKPGVVAINYEELLEAFE